MNFDKQAKINNQIEPSQNYLPNGKLEVETFKNEEDSLYFSFLISVFVPIFHSEEKFKKLFEKIFGEETISSKNFSNFFDFVSPFCYSIVLDVNKK